ncbi:unnamed protein product, partial [Mesorhabditis spiculigera]
MRNVARIGSLTELQFLADIEMTFSRNFEAQIRPVANEWMMQGNRTVFIIRRFEATIYPDPHIPKDILALRARFRQKTATFFHRFSFPEGHFIEEQGEWVDASIETQEIAVKPHRYRGGFWEPQPLLHKSAPLCHENVPTRLRDMQYCIYALCRAGYQFAVPTHVFNVHPGIRNTTSPLDTAIRNHQKPLGGAYWEPQPLLHKSAPLCYENVPTRVRDMQYCIYALCRAGYQFAVPSHMFNVHPGIRKTTSSLDAAIANHQKPLGPPSVDGFQKVMDLQYPETGDRCGSFLKPLRLPLKP